MTLNQAKTIAIRYANNFMYRSAMIVKINDRYSVVVSDECMTHQKRYYPQDVVYVIDGGWTFGKVGEWQHGWIQQLLEYPAPIVNPITELSHIPDWLWQLE